MSRNLTHTVTNPTGISGPKWTRQEDNILIGRKQAKLKLNQVSSITNRTVGAIKLRIFRLRQYGILD